jgi:hypothetical protein
MKEKIWKGRSKYCIIAIIILILTFSIGSFVIVSLDGMLTNKEIDYVDAVVADKYINNDSEHYYVIVSQDGDLFDIINITDNAGLYEKITVGGKYRFITKQPYSENDNYIHIVQVHNGTS